jgi:isopenicillin-N N-acyltransferase-like protein
MEMAIPVLDLSGTAMERGRAHGRALKADIVHNVDVYVRRFGKLGYDRQRVLEEAAKWLPHLERFDPEFTAEMRGVAEGAGRELPEIAMLNVRYEMIISMFKRAGMAASAGAVDGCTSFAVLPERSKSGETLIGQNWDWIPEVKTMVARVAREDRPSYICHGETGTVGGMQGVNSAGIGVVINALMSKDDGRYAYEKPFRMRVRDVLNARTMHDAIGALCGTNRVVSMNFIVGHADGEAMDIEVSPDRAGFLYPEDGILAHSNHFCGLDIESEVVGVWPNTMYRNKRLERLLRQQQQLDETKILGAMGDHFAHPHSICAHVDENEPELMQLETRNSVLIALKQRKMYVTEGQPCRAKYQEVTLAA